MRVFLDRRSSPLAILPPALRVRELHVYHVAQDTPLDDERRPDHEQHRCLTVSLAAACHAFASGLAVLPDPVEATHDGLGMRQDALWPMIVAAAPNGVSRTSDSAATAIAVSRTSAARDFA